MNTDFIKAFNEWLARHNTWSWKLDIEIKEIQDKIKELEK